MWLRSIWLCGYRFLSDFSSFISTTPLTHCGICYESIKICNAHSVNMWFVQIIIQFLLWTRFAIIIKVVCASELIHKPIHMCELNSTFYVVKVTINFYEGVWSIRKCFGLYFAIYSECLILLLMLQSIFLIFQHANSLTRFLSHMFGMCMVFASGIYFISVST